MGMFDYFRKGKVVESEVEKISFDEIGKWITTCRNDLREDEKEILEDVDERLKDFYVSFGEKLEVLENIDVESRKEHGHAKLLVRQGLDRYVNFVHVLLGSLREIKMKDLDEVIRKIGIVFGRFEKDSAKSYERATYLIGDEIKVVRNEIRAFYNGLVEMFRDGNSAIGGLVKIRNVKMKLNEFENGKKAAGVIQKEIGARDCDIEKHENKVKKMKNEAEEIKLSSEHVANTKRVEGIGVLRSEIEKEIYSLKSLIDFKKIIGIVHGNEREFGLIKNYRDRFSVEFSVDEGKKLLKLLESLNMKSSAIREKFDLIGHKSKEMERCVGKVGIDKAAAKLVEIEKIRDEIDGMKTEKAKIERRLEDAEFKLKGLGNEIVGLAERIGGVRVVD